MYIGPMPGPIYGASDAAGDKRTHQSRSNRQDAAATSTATQCGMANPDTPAIDNLVFVK